MENSHTGVIEIILILCFFYGRFTYGIMVLLEM